MAPPRNPDAEGDLQSYPLPRLLFYLYKKRFTGQLLINERGLEYACVSYREGLPVRCDLTSREDVLGAVLLERGVISQDDFNRSLHELAKGEKLHGRILMEMNVLDEKQLVDGLRLQLRRKLNRLFYLTEATFALYAGDHPHGIAGEAQRVRADPLWIIFHGVHNAFDRDRLAPELERLNGTMLRLRPEFAQIAPRYKMGQDEAALVTALTNQAMLINQVFAISNLGPMQTQMLIYTLWITEALIVTRPTAAAHQAVGAQPAAGQPPRRSPTPVITSAPPAAAAASAAEPRQRRPTGGSAVRRRRISQSIAGTHPGRAVPPSGESASIPIPTLNAPIDERPARRSQETSAAPSQRSPEAEQARRTILEAHASLEEKTYYELLGVDRDAPTTSIRDAYFALAKRFHPDRMTALGLADVQAEAQAIFRKINEANSVLADTEKRRAYDERLRAGDSGEPDEAQRTIQAEIAFQKATVAFRKRDFDTALAQFKESTRLNPEEGEHLAWVAWTVYSDPRTNKEAIIARVKQQLLEAIKLSPRSAQCHYFLGEVYLAMDDPGRAVTCFNQVLELQPGHIEAERHLRLIRMRKRRDKKETGEGRGLFSRFRKR
ncbi:MAG: DnaJ domain-containing protein [Deltaproteobacteria bacterium]|nr:DnaJ domain-containing protein [Deltaproteobacteria bacterium]